MQTTGETEAGRNFAERILAELRAVRSDLDRLRRDVMILNECATLLVRPMHEDDESPFQAMMRLLGLLVGGTEETHKRLEALHQATIDPRLSAALRSVIP